MKGYIIITLITICFAPFIGLAQQTDHQCGADHVMEKMMEQDQAFLRKVFVLNRKISSRLSSGEERNNDIYSIPVVVHVINEGEPIGQGSNISDAQVISAIDGLTEDFRKMAGTNGDGEGVDCKLEFCLAKRTPEGDPTNGIVRVDGSSVPLYAEQGIRASGSEGAIESDVKALSTWPREDYMNIWVVNEIEDNDALNGIQGYAYFPVELDIDGIVVLHNAFGTVGNLKPNTALNRTTSHEAGHFFGLYHTFHDTQDCSAEIDCATQGDRVCDTPLTPLSVSCASPACAGTQQTENYMDYTAESCRNMFSQGQKDRMRSTLELERTSLLSSVGCVPISDSDVSITEVISPQGSSCSTVLTPEVRLTNYGNQVLTSAEINFGIDFTNTTTFDWTGSLASGASINVELPSMSTAFGSHTFHASAENPNGVADENPVNNEMLREFIIASGATIELDVTLDYFGAETTWDVVNDEGSLIASGGPYVNSNQGLVMDELICVDEGCYTLTVYDAYGDGMGFTSGTFELRDADGSVIASGGGDFGPESIHDFCIEVEEGGSAPNAGFNTSENTICTGESINFNDISSNSPTSWSWTFEGGSPSSSSLQNPQNITYAADGTFGVTLEVSNEFGTDEYNMNVNVSTSPDISITSTAPLCSGQNTGTAVASATGSGLSYSWNNGQSGSNLIGVTAGNYTVTVSNNSGCSSQESVQISSTDEINIALTANNPLCANQTNGSIDAIISGGQTPYDFSWSNGNQNQNLNNVGTGSYTLTVNDTNGCTAQSSANVTSPTELDLGLEVLDISCGNTTGSASINPTGGSSPYTIVWSTGSSQYGIEDLGVGSYSISVFDANSCSTSQNFSINEGNSLNLIESVNHISCDGNNDGSISVNILGGSGDYDISWSNGPSDNNISNLAAGNYTINVIDSEGCSGEETYTIEEQADLQISVFKTDISCHGMNDGSAQATITGGISPYNIEWSNGDETAQSVGLSQGEYEIQVSDQNGCSSSETVTIIQPSELTVSTVVLNNETCEGSDGSAAVNIMGGTGDYQILWSNGSVNNNAQNLGAGQYSVTVSDASGCQAFSGIEIIYDCEIQVPQSMLANGSCGEIGFMLDDFVHCVPVENASMYQWKFENIPAGLFFEAYTMGNNPSLPLEEVMNLNYGMDANVSVRAQVNNTWGSYGNVCSIGMNSQIPNSSLSKSDCGATDLLIGASLECVQISGAYAYEWNFHGPGVDTIAMSYINSIQLLEQYNFSAGQTYQVTVRAQVGDQFGQWGMPCSIHFDGESSINDLAQNNPTANIYPNPSNGENISIEMWNLFEKVDVIDIDVYDTSGKLIERIKLSPYGRTHFKEDYRFKHRLTPGMYFLRYKLGEKVKEEKLIIR